MTGEFDPNDRHFNDTTFYRLHQTLCDANCASVYYCFQDDQELHQHISKQATCHAIESLK